MPNTIPLPERVTFAELADLFRVPAHRMPPDFAKAFEGSPDGTLPLRDAIAAWIEYANPNGRPYAPSDVRKWTGEILRDAEVRRTP
jgi:hypothetical protein